MINNRGYECGCRVSDNLFCSVYCVYDHLVSNHPVLWLRDSSLIRPGYISRNLMCDAGNVLAIWNGPLKGWRLRTFKEESLDEKPDPLRKEFVELSQEDVRFQAFLIMSDDFI